jgi:AcrR family transcriptional regulator
MGGRGKVPSSPTGPEKRYRSGSELGRDQVIDIQRGRILAAMIEISAERGFTNASVAHVVSRAGVSRRTFYQLFDDREECFITAFDDTVTRASSYVRDLYDSKAGWVERIRTSLTGLLAFLDVHRGAGQLLIVGSLGAGASMLERRQRVLVQIIKAVDEGRNERRTGLELPLLTAESLVGGALAVLHSRLLITNSPFGLEYHVPSDPDDRSLLELTGPLMSMIVLPYLGIAAARRELKRPTPVPDIQGSPQQANPLRDLRMRLTYRTARVLMAVAASPRSSNREIGIAADVPDQGQISRLLMRLSRLGLIENGGAGQARGGPNAWMLTGKGVEVERAIGQGAG